MSSTQQVETVTDTQAPKKTRKPRSDLGKKRGPRKPKDVVAL